MEGRGRMGWVGWEGGGRRMRGDGEDGREVGKGISGGERGASTATTGWGARGPVVKGYEWATDSLCARTRREPGFEAH